MGDTNYLSFSTGPGLEKEGGKKKDIKRLEFSSALNYFHFLKLLSLAVFLEFRRAAAKYFRVTILTQFR